tara:strand:- start:244 stop:438 length:195 start_codon:yes stop_codon:yes gene_type:complete
MFKMYRVTDNDIKLSSADFDDEEADQLYVGLGVTLTNLQIGLIGATFFMMIGVLLSAGVALVII